MDYCTCMDVVVYSVQLYTNYSSNFIQQIVYKY